MQRSPHHLKPCKGYSSSTTRHWTTRQFRLCCRACGVSGWWRREKCTSTPPAKWLSASHGDRRQTSKARTHDAMVWQPIRTNGFRVQECHALAAAPALCWPLHWINACRTTPEGQKMKLTPESLVTIAMSNPVNVQIAARLPSLGLSQCMLTAGCLFQAVWNHHSNLPPATGVKDYDVF